MIRHANHAAKSRSLLFRCVTRGEINERERAVPARVGRTLLSDKKLVAHISSGLREMEIIPIQPRTGRQNPAHGVSRRYAAENTSHARPHAERL
ncbi:MAG: hypothetical protein DMG88_19085 [Acidobacteria bacterium]|nr:MAG: hypothetical protein DMG88_19085 [Acidobacteriota bacterium]